MHSRPHITITSSGQPNGPPARPPAFLAHMADISLHPRPCPQVGFPLTRAKTARAPVTYRFLTPADYAPLILWLFTPATDSDRIYFSPRIPPISTPDCPISRNTRTSPISAITIKHHATHALPPSQHPFRTAPHKHRRPRALPHTRPFRRTPSCAICQCQGGGEASVADAVPEGGSNALWKGDHEV